IPYPAVHERLIASGVEGVVVVYDNQLGDTSVRSNIDVDSDGFVTLYEKDSARELRYVEAGVLALRKSCIDLMRPEGAVSLEKEIFPLLIARRKLAAHVTQQLFYETAPPARTK